MKLVFATHNENKFREVQAQMPKHIELMSLTDIGCNEDIAETADTIEGNAVLKARYVKDKYGYDCFADDTGLEVPALKNAPGIYSARYAGPEKDSNANMQKLLNELDNDLSRDARFKTAIALTYKKNDVLFIGLCEGKISKDLKGERGFGYDPIFKPNGFEQTFAQMDLSQKASIGHRGKAITKLLEYLSE